MQVDLHGANDDMDDASKANVEALKALAVNALEKTALRKFTRTYGS